MERRASPPGWTAAAKAEAEKGPLIAAVNRCATQKQNKSRLFSNLHDPENLFFAAAHHPLTPHIGHVDGVDVLFRRQLLEARDIRIPNLLPARQ